MPFYIFPYSFIPFLIADNIIMVRTLPNNYLGIFFMNIPGDTGFILGNYLIQITLTGLIQNNNHMNVIWHYHIFINHYAIIMFRNLQNMILNNLSKGI